MTVLILIFVFAFLALLSVLWFAKGHASRKADVEQLRQELRPVDLQAFRNLVDPAEEDYLRRCLSGSEFRRIQRERMLAALDYVSGVARNAGILLQLGDLAQQSTDPEIARAGQKLKEDAIQLRLATFSAIGKLYIGVIFPGGSISAGRLVDRYENTSRLAVHVGRLYPVRGLGGGL